MDGSVQGSCEACFCNIREAYHDSMRATIPLQTDLECFSCGSCPARFNKDLSMGMCDDCYRQQREQELHFQAGREMPMDVVPDELVPGSVFIGAKEAAANPETLRARNIKRVIVCCSSIPMFLARPDEECEEIRYLRLTMADSLDQNLMHYIPHAFAFLEEGVRCGEGTLVHCNAGVSRSGAVVVAWLMRTRGLSFADALSLAKSKRQIITPNSNFAEQLKDAIFST
jgi:predicted protein tyrosine phosphatase